MGDDGGGGDDAEYITLSGFLSSPKGWLIMGFFGGMFLWSTYFKGSNSKIELLFVSVVDSDFFFKERGKIRDYRDPEPETLPEADLLAELNPNDNGRKVLDAFQQRRKDKLGNEKMSEHGVLINRVCGASHHGIKNIVKFYDNWNASFISQHWRLLRIVLDEKSVWAEYELKAVHEGVWEGVFQPSHRQIDLRISIYMKYDPENDMFCEEIWYLDSPNSLINTRKGIEFTYDKKATPFAI